MCLIAGQTEDMWTPYKELYKSIETNLVRDTQVPSSELEQILRKYKQNFFNLLQNPVSVAIFSILFMFRGYAVILATVFGRDKFNCHFLNFF